jgi:tetratricopeptide (TPR) repeat protein
MFFNLAKEALKASGLRDAQRIVEYLDKLELLAARFALRADAPLSVSAGAKMLFEGLWQHRAGRYRPNGNYRLNKVIDAQFKDGDHAVGNCLGLTVLYNCLLEKIGIQAEALHLQNAFKTGPHVLTLLRTNDGTVQIENILPHGFDYKGHLQDPSGERWGPQALVADIYHSTGNELFRQGQFRRALKNYETALKLNPHYESARLNTVIVRDRLNLAGEQ